MDWHTIIYTLWLACIIGWLLPNQLILFLLIVLVASVALYEPSDGVSVAHLSLARHLFE